MKKRGKKSSTSKKKIVKKRFSIGKQPKEDSQIKYSLPNPIVQTHNFLKENYKKIILSTLLILFIVLIYVYFKIPYNCKYDENCFDERFSDCRKTDFYKVMDGDTYQFECKGGYKDSCLMNIRLIIANPKSDDFVKENMVGRGMLCKLPEGQFSQLNQINNSLDYCTGPLKEAFLELMIKNMYEKIISKMEAVTAEDWKVN